MSNAIQMNSGSILKRILPETLTIYVCITLFFLYKNVVFLAQAEYSYISADFSLKIFLYYSYVIAYVISVLEYIGVSSIVSAGFLPCWQVLPFREWNKSENI